jgi:Transglutaminase-like superfamily
MNAEALPHARRGAVARLALAVEITRAYVRVRWLLWRSDTIVEAVASLRSGIGTPVGGEQAIVTGRRLARPILRTLEKLPGDSRCLTRSMVLLALLSDRDVEATLVIGVSTADGFSAHAWVEHGTVPLLPFAGYEPLTRL